MLRFWQTHGGLAVFGMPISELYTAPNADGTGRSYQMQLFENARLEYHPESPDPRHSILLGMLGRQALLPLGWTILN